VKLVEVFGEFKPVVRGGGNFGRYAQVFNVEPKEGAPKLTLQDLESYVRNLRERYPGKDFKLRRVVVGSTEYFVIDKRSYYRDERGRRHEVADRVPIYFDLERQKFFIPQSYIRRKRVLASYIAMVVLGALKVAQTKYARMGRAT